MVRSGVSTRKRRTRKRRTRVRSQRVKCRTRRKTRPRRTVRKKRKSLRGGTSFATGIPGAHGSLYASRPEIQVYCTPCFAEIISKNPSADSLLVLKEQIQSYLDITLEQIQYCYAKGIRLLIVTAHQHSILELCLRCNLDPASAVADPASAVADPASAVADPASAVAEAESAASEPGWEFHGIQQFTRVGDEIKLNNLKYVIMRKGEMYLMLIRHCEGTHQKPRAAVMDYHGINQTCMNQYLVDQNSYLGIAGKIEELATLVNNTDSLSGKKYSVIDMVEGSEKPAKIPVFAVQSKSHNMGVTVKSNLVHLPNLEKSVDDNTPLMCNNEKMESVTLFTSQHSLNPKTTRVRHRGVGSPAVTPSREPHTETGNVKFVSSPIFRAMMTMENTLRALKAKEPERQASVGA
jgi:hypothetical protein